MNSFPRIPITELKDAIEKSVGNDCVEKIQPRRVFKMLQTRNVLVHFTDVESLQVSFYESSTKFVIFQLKLCL